jgi:hypothetical protein
MASCDAQCEGNKKHIALTAFPFAKTKIHTI